jgi:hypothetical protein
VFTLREVYTERAVRVHSRVACTERSVRSVFTLESGMYRAERAVAVVGVHSESGMYRANVMICSTAA